jgi:spermidine synthase
MEPNRGSLEGDWFYEEDQGRSRFGIRIAEHLHSERSAWQKIDVYRSDFHGNVLTLDDLVMLTTRDEFVYHEMLVHVPLCAIENPRQVLIIGGGDCGCIREALRHDSVERIVQCEIDERVTRVSQDYYDWVRPTIADPRVELVFDDGVKYIDANRESFDLIIIDSTDPIGPAVGLFLADFYRKAASALRPGGVMAAQTEAPFWYPMELGKIHAQMRDAFEVVEHYWGAIPTYPSGSWTWAFASNDRRPADFLDQARAGRVERATRYWNMAIQQACFQLPNFVREALKGSDPFSR